MQCFIIFHLVAITLWSLPNSLLRTQLMRPFASYMLWSGLWQEWDMFAPDPLRLNISLDADITFADGSHTVWVFPRMEALGWWRRYHKERFRKWREHIREDAYAVAWPDTARWIARLHVRSDNPPVHVALTRHWSEIAAPPPNAAFLPHHWTTTFDNHYTFFNYTVQPEDL